jgi:hypothetical protein
VTDPRCDSHEAGRGQGTHGKDARKFIPQVTYFTEHKEQGGCVNKSGLHFSLRREKGRRFHWKLEKELEMLVQRVE